MGQAVGSPESPRAAVPSAGADRGRDPAPDAPPAHTRLPRQPRFAVARPRLFEELARSAALPVTIVRGSGGLGKTGLVVNWLEHGAGSGAPPMPAVWLNGSTLAAAGPIGRDAFWAAVLAGLPGRAGASPATGPPRGAGLVAALRAAAAGRPVLLVVDGWNHAESGELESELLAAAAAVPELHWLLTTRTVGALERRRSLLDLEVAVIGPEALRLTEPEVAAMLRDTGLEGEAEEVLRAAGGSVRFVRAVRLRALELRAVGPVGLADVLRAVVLDVRSMLESGAVAHDLAGFLARTALPETFGEELAVRLTADRESGRKMREAHARGFGDFAGVRDTEFAYVPLVRSALLAELEERYEAELPGLRRECAVYLSERGEPVEALRHAVASGRLRLVAGIVVRHAPALLDDPARQDTIALLGDLPTARLAEYPLVAAVLALAYNASGLHRARGQELLALAVSGARLRARSADASERMVLAVVEVVALRVGGRLAPAEAAARRALARHAQMPVAERDRIAAFEDTLLLQLALTLAMAGRADDAAGTAALAVTMASRSGDAARKGYALGVAAYLDAAEGDVRRAAAKVERSLSKGWLAPGTNTYVAAPLLLARSVVAFESLDVEAGRSALEPLRGDFETSEFWPQILGMTAMFDLLAGEPARSLGALRAVASRGRELPPTSPSLKLGLEAAAVWLHLGLGDGAAALSVLRRHRGGGRWTEMLEARVHLARREPGSVLRLTVHTEGPASPRHRLDAAVLALAARLQLGDDADAARRLEEITGIADVFGLTSPITLLPAPDLHRVLAAAAAHGVELPVPAGYRPVISGDLPSVLLTARETAVLRELEASGNVAAIAESLFVSVNTVKSQLRSVYRKLGARSRDEAVAAARRQGLLRG